MKLSNKEPNIKCKWQSRKNTVFPISFLNMGNTIHPQTVFLFETMCEGEGGKIRIMEEDVQIVY